METGGAGPEGVATWCSGGGLFPAEQDCGGWGGGGGACLARSHSTERPAWPERGKR